MMASLLILGHALILRLARKPSLFNAKPFAFWR